MPSANTTVRDQHRAVIRRGRPPCGICFEPIDYQLKHPHPDSYVVDHIIPTSRGGTDTLDNKQAAHRRCNRAKSASTVDELTAKTAPRTFITTRTW